MASASPWDVTRSVQRALALEPSGVWTQSTDQAYLAAPTELRSQIDAQLRAQRFSRESLMSVTRKITEKSQLKPVINEIRTANPKVTPRQRPTYATARVHAVSREPSPAVQRVMARADVKARKTANRQDSVISVAEAQALADTADGVFGLPQGTMRFILNLEAQKVFDQGKLIGYDAGAKGGSGNRYLGLYQIFDLEKSSKGPYAWGMARNYAKRKGVNIGSISNWADPRANTLAAAAYAGFHADEIRKLGKEPTPGLLYTAHQQGIGALRRMLDSGTAQIAGKQSAASVAAIQQALSA